MPMRRSRGRARPATVLLSIIAAVSLLSACAGRGVSRSAEPYSGPPITAEAIAGQHVVVLNAPSVGWSFTLDQTEREVDHTDVFLTATRPNPAMMHTQALVRHEVGTTVPASTAVEVFVRVLEYGEKAGSQPYRRALSVPAVPGAEPARR